MLARYYCIIALFLIISLNCHEENTTFVSFIPQVIIVLVELLKIKNSSHSRNKTWIYNIFATMDSFSFIGTLHFAFLLTVNRFVAMNLPRFNVFFETVRFYFLIAFVWLSVFVPSLTEFLYCDKTFVVSNLEWSMNCTGKSPKVGRILLNIRYVWTLTLPIIMFAMYVSIFYNMRRKRRNISDQKRNEICTSYQARIKRQTGKYEFLMVMQGAAICSAIEIQVFCFYFLPQIAVKIAGKKIEIPVHIFVNCYVIFNSAVLPTVNLVFVKRFRDNVKQAVPEWISKVTNTIGMNTLISFTKVQPISRVR
ncbi:hypothetical protein LOAG_11138 [Loa loa]|uniref:Uncharacterized protein n=1 Tax=Loa loa TaxID=7209 RepID=A0A1S0TP25_LOALO|nr:hypothetical protein LOAG_11138 [Loa loa]EFO17361.2 hypothetical protein LOAG_11138 [Loa loa]